ncbi:MAG: hypothetical protein C4525_15150 [Desulfarculus sp.]|nr:MAG: hypothetical protein C4525_15150 [Desulfarculus sp.]
MAGAGAGAGAAGLAWAAGRGGLAGLAGGAGTCPLLWMLAILRSRDALSRRSCKAATWADSLLSCCRDPALARTASSSFSRVTRRSIRSPTSFSSLATRSAVAPGTTPAEGGGRGELSGPRSRAHSPNTRAISARTRPITPAKPPLGLGAEGGM